MPELIVAAATPLTEGAERPDLDAIGPMVAFLVRHGADGIFCCGTTGEGVLLSGDERRAVARGFREALSGRLIVDCGAQTTADTVALASHAADIGADGVAVIPPPYYPLDAAALEEHFIAAARACAPLPFFVYAFAARSGYPVPVEVVASLREHVGNLAGIKVSESPFARVERYFAVDLPLYVGNEPLIPAGLEHGAAGAVSGLAAALPDVVRSALGSSDPAAAEARLRRLRDVMEEQPFIASVKHVLGRRGVPVNPAVRPPLRRLTADEASRLDERLDVVADDNTAERESFGDRSG